VQRIRNVAMLSSYKRLQWARIRARRWIDVKGVVT
jgi:hypothetical protein